MDAENAGGARSRLLESVPWQVICPCHGSRFNVTTGDVLHGPARKPVRSYPVRLESGTLRVEV